MGKQKRQISEKWMDMRMRDRKLHFQEAGLRTEFERIIHREQDENMENHDAK